MKLDDAPWHVLYWVVIGFCFVLLFRSLFSAASSGLFVGCFLLTLFGLRVGPALLRRLIPFSKEVQEMWALRRQWAKLYDSYQWRKLLWIGLGMAAGATFVHRTLGYEMTVAAFCIIVGSLGTVFWRRRKRQMEVAAAP